MVLLPEEEEEEEEEEEVPSKLRILPAPVPHIIFLVPEFPSYALSLTQNL
jgi:hypothetical protein